MVRAASRGEDLTVPLTSRYGLLNRPLVALDAAGGAAGKHLATGSVGEPDVDAAAFTWADDAIGADDM
jgi:hypothetical protein